MMATLKKTSGRKNQNTKQKNVLQAGSLIKELTVFQQSSPNPEPPWHSSQPMQRHQLLMYSLQDENGQPEGDQKPRR